jgi:hypothetical protein
MLTQLGLLLWQARDWSSVPLLTLTDSLPRPLDGTLEPPPPSPTLRCFYLKLVDGLVAHQDGLQATSQALETCDSVL